MALPSLTLPQVLATYRIPEACVLLYEREGLVSPMRSGGEKQYTARDQIRIEVVLKGKKLGFSLLEIKKLIATHLPEPSPPSVDPDKLRLQIAQLETEKADLQDAIDRLRAKTESD